MRILFAIPHYFGLTAGGGYGSERTVPEARARVIRQCLASLQQTFSPAQALLDGRLSAFHPVNPRLSAQVTIALCTTGQAHLVADLQGIGFEHVRTQAEPRHLGFECHKVLRAGLGQYDYFAYLEDDLRLVDGLLFAKLGWFQSQFGEAAVLQPNRFELIDEPAPYKLYIDGNMHGGTIAPDQPGLAEYRRVEVPAFGQGLVFQRVQNAHAGCFFLSAAQLARWAAEPDFAVPSAAFGGPLESAATLGLIRYFRVYKPARENAAFLEIEHLDRRYLGLRFFTRAGNPPSLLWG
jgi:hypothetical protein